MLEAASLTILPSTQHHTDLTMTNFDIAIEFNDEGVKMMTNENFLVAISLFQKALKVLKHSVEEPESQKKCDLRFRVIHFPGPCHGGNERPFLFMSPLQVERVLSNTEGGGDSLANVVSAVVFNLAISMHACALASDTTEEAVSRRLKKTLVFYELASNMMDGENHLGLTPFVAIQNNTAQVQRLLGKGVLACQRYEELLGLLICAKQAGVLGTIIQFDRFHESALSAVLPKSKVALAA